MQYSKLTEKEGNGKGQNKR